MQLAIITRPSRDHLPDELFFYELDHSTEPFYKKARPYSKLTVPSAYTQNEALCRQFGISPPSILCMESTLWRQQIVDRVIFDLIEESIQIKLIDGSEYLYSFEHTNKVLRSLHTFESQSTRTSTTSDLCHRMKQKLLLHLDSLHPPQEPNERFESNLRSLCRSTSRQLAILKRYTRLYPLQPTLIQSELDDRRAQQRGVIPILKNKKQSKKRPSSGSGAPKSQKRTNIATSSLESQKSQDEVERIISNFGLSYQDLYLLVLHLITYRATLVDFFQSIVLPILRTELPALYSLWTLQSQIRSLQKHYINLSLRFVNLLDENKALDNFESLTSSNDRLNLIAKLRGWCEIVKASSTPSDLALRIEDSEQQVSSSAETSLHEPSFSSNGELLQLPCVLTQDSKPHLTTEEHHSLNHRILNYRKLDPHTTPSIRPVSMASCDIRSPFDEVIFNKPQGGSGTRSPTCGAGRDRTPSLSPPSKSFTQPRRLRTIVPSIFHLPLASLDVDLLSSIKSEDSRQLAIKLAMELAEECLEIQGLEDNFQVLELLEEERECKDRFAGISRFSSIVTNARLMSGNEGCTANLAKKAIIKRALEGTMPRSVPVGGADAQDVVLRPAYQGPSKRSEDRRQRAIKRKAWLATTRRLNYPRGDQEELFDGQCQVWPEPIFLKKPVLKRFRNSSESDADSEDGGKRRRSKDFTSGKSKRKERGDKLDRVVEPVDGFQESREKRKRIGSKGVHLVSEPWLDSESVDDPQICLEVHSTQIDQSSPYSSDQSADVEFSDRVSLDDAVMSSTGSNEAEFKHGLEKLRTDDHRSTEYSKRHPDEGPINNALGANKLKRNSG